MILEYEQCTQQGFVSIGMINASCSGFSDQSRYWKSSSRRWGRTTDLLLCGTTGALVLIWRKLHTIHMVSLKVVDQVKNTGKNVRWR